ncbi:HNH/ENDO VII family nuclease [Citrobacter portucalensis]|uniref:HNH/ENDO VII family nuclease n=1 Tax=Citrobacter portucalensis TaxID=1639133 RepID=UPI0018E37DD7|nr:HNH/ENDO VII family nuclease [Citrobacter portucalensis]MBI1681497.1 nuclease [Citrobacter portucalensis]
MSEMLVLETTLEIVGEHEGLTELTRDIDIIDIDIDKLDEPLKTVDTPLTELSDEMRETLRDNGYSEDVIERIGSEQEAQIYLDAGLECESVNGKDVLVQPDINPDQVDELGRTNLERMEKGLPPQDADGKPYQLHHIGQNADSPLAELTQSEHMGGGNNKILHDVTKESEIDRGDFKTERIDHWKQRAEDIKNQRNEAAA